MAYCSPQGHKESDMTEPLDSNSSRFRNPHQVGEINCVQPQSLKASPVGTIRLMTLTPAEVRFGFTSEPTTSSQDF